MSGKKLRMAAGDDEFFEASDFFTGPPLTPALVAAAEAALGFTLPTSYLELLRERNGGVPKRRFLPTPFPTSWAPDHIEIEAILGIAGTWGIDSDSGHGSRDLIREWAYPDVGVVVCFLPSGGHDTVMLDYSTSGPGGPPRVVHVDEDRIPRPLATGFDDFIASLIADPTL